MKQLLLVAVLLLATAFTAGAQEKPSAEEIAEECAQMRTYPLGKVQVAEVVWNCQAFKECGMDPVDYKNCVRASVISILLYEMMGGGNGEEDGEGNEDENAAKMVMNSKGRIDFGDLTYGQLYDKIIEYTKRSAYQSQKGQRNQLTTFEKETVTDENWPEMRDVLKGNGFTDAQLKEMHALWRQHKIQAWTYGDLLRKYGEGDRNVD